AMRVELIELQRRLGTTFVYVTHDQIEAMSMADTIVLMEKGEIQQIGSPEEIYHEPVNIFSAQFIGTPPMNIMELGDGIRYGVRPESLVMEPERLDGMALYRKGHIVTREMLGAELQFKVRLSDGVTIMARSGREDLAEDSDVWVMALPRHIHFFGADGKRLGHGGPQALLDRLGGMNE
ncbi:MAG: TOBE domain-containing protein, partial [Lachnospiraceae bacterium]|nr:TOBE domain-containing protein [Lachnospiraceae bacterium]